MKLQFSEYVSLTKMLDFEKALSLFSITCGLKSGSHVHHGITARDFLEGIE